MPAGGRQDASFGAQGQASQSRFSPIYEHPTKGSNGKQKETPKALFRVTETLGEAAHAQAVFRHLKHRFCSWDHYSKHHSGHTEVKDSCSGVAKALKSVGLKW